MTRPIETVSLNLLEAIYKWCDPDLIARFRLVADMRFENPVDAVVAAVGPDAWKVKRYFELRQALLLQLGTKVKNKTLIVTGFSALTPLGPAAEISADLWPVLAFDLSTTLAL